MKAIKSIIGVLLASALLVSLASCSDSKKANVNSTGSGSYAPATLTVIFQGDNSPPASNNVLKQITKKTNITINPIYVPSTDYTSKINVLAASKNLPDIFTLSDISSATDYKKNGAVADLTKLVPKYMTHYYPDVKNELEKNSLNTGGKIYALFSTKVGYSANMSIRTDWLKNVGLSMPTDLDSLYNVLDAFTNKDPNKNGKKDTYGLEAAINSNTVSAGWTEFSTIFGAYGVPAGRPVQLKDGTVTTWLKADKFLDAVKYFNKLYQNGLMDPDFATIPTMNSFGKLWNGQAGALDFQCVGTTNNWMPSRYTETPTPTFDFATIKGPSGKAGVPVQYPAYASSVLVASTCKAPDAAVRFLDYIYSEEGDTLLRLGVEGLHFNWTDKANGKYTMIKPYDDATTNRNDGVFVYWSVLISPKDNAEVRTFNKQTQDGVAAAYKNSTIPWAYITVPFAADKTYGTNLLQIEKEAFCTLVTTKGDIDAEYKKAISRWNSEGGTQWEKEATAAYKSQK